MKSLNPPKHIKTYSVDEMLARNGRYVITTKQERMFNRYALCEVESGVCHQLDPAGKRDGELSNDGWQPSVILVDESDLKDLMEWRHQ